MSISLAEALPGRLRALGGRVQAFIFIVMPREETFRTEIALAERDPSTPWLLRFANQPLRSG